MKNLEDKIWSNPSFRALVKERNRFMWWLFALVLITYFGFALLAIFAPAVFGIPLWPGASTTIGVPLGIGVMFLPCLLTGIYVFRSIRNFDVRMEAILRDAEKS